ncbi:MAG TPA: protein kinase, partial [Gemmatimonadales bacterium]|nr:protein kinase [Gemmatimonadales bacterium]
MTASDSERMALMGPLLDRAVELPPDELRTWLAELALTAPDTARALEALLATEPQLDELGFLGGTFAPAASSDLPSLAGTRIGAYALERRVGQGGMGSVWLARRSDGRFEGRVAVKLLNLALLDPVGSERFRREGTTLARLAHPNIARLIDAGITDAGQPFLVLEYVEGTRIDRYCDEQKLGVAARLALFQAVL